MDNDIQTDKRRAVLEKKLLRSFGSVLKLATGLQPYLVKKLEMRMEILLPFS